MISDTFAAIRRAYSGAAARAAVAAISQHHRIQASPGYRAAAAYIHDALHSAGLETAIETFPATESARFWSAPSFQEWSAAAGTLHLVEPADQARKLADYRDVKLALIPRSIPFDGEVELVVLDDGTRPTHYEQVDVRGKLVMTSGGVETVRQLAVAEHGAVGILYDGMALAPPVRERLDLPEARQYTSFWWAGVPADERCFGFTLTPRQGAWLRELAARRAAAGKPPVRLRAHVDSRLYDGSFEVVTAVIPGASDRSVVAVSHLCHPEPSANDNASGAAANLEVARTLHRLIAEGELPPPRHAIRFLWLPEMTGSYAYLAAHEDDIPGMIAGVNLDMVGADQEETGAIFMLERPPDAMPSFTVDLLERLREELFDDARSYNGTGGYAHFRYATIDFAGGSDHFIFSDPSVGVPMPMIIQWPDRYYHTSLDTIDKVSAATLQRTGSLAAAYLYFVATAGESETRWLAEEMLARFQRRVSREAQQALTALWPPQDGESGGGDGADGMWHLLRQQSYGLDRFRAALQTLSRLWPDAEGLAGDVAGDGAAFVEQQLARARRLAGRWGLEVAESPARERDSQDEWERRAAEMRPRRLRPGPGLAIGGVASLAPEARATWLAIVRDRSGFSGHTLCVLAEFWADGRRSALEIIDLVELESGTRDAELIVHYLEVLAQLGAMALTPTDP